MIREAGEHAMRDGTPANAAAELTAAEVADAMWLAAQIGPAVTGAVSTAYVGPVGGPGARHVTEVTENGGRLPAKFSQPSLRDSAPSSTSGHRDSPVEVERWDTTGELALPSSPLDAMAFARALRPLGRPKPSQRDWRLDEEATAIGAAESGLWWPRLRPADTKRFDAVLVVDDGPSMEPWQDTAENFRRILERQGAFQDVRVVRIDTSFSSPTTFSGHREPNGSAAHRLAELRDPSGQRVIFVLTDGVSDAWRRRSLAGWLGQWGRTEHLVVVNVLPQHMWNWGHLVPHRTWLAASGPGMTNRRLKWLVSVPHVPRTGHVLPIPVLELNPRWLARWARLVAATGPTRVELPVMLLDLNPTVDDNGDGHPPDENRIEVLTPVERVLRFRAVASPAAYRLARLLAAAPLDLSLMRHIQDRMVPESDRSTLAEVFLGGLLTRGGSGESAARYDFIDGVRAELLSAGLRQETADVVRLVAALSGPHTTGIRNLTTVLASPRAARDVHLPTNRLEATVLTALSGPYVAEISGEPTEQTDREPIGGVADVSTSVLPNDWFADDTPATLHDVPPRPHNFVGRQAIFDAIGERFQRGDATAVIWGLGGIGKTQIAAEYSHRFGRDYDVVWWVHALDPTRTAASLSEMSEELGGTGTGAGERWLLVMDDAGPPDDVLSPVENFSGNVLITSRDPLWTSSSEVLRLDPFTRAESLELLLTRCRRLHPGHADAIAELLEDLPLAVDQAASLLARTGLPPAEYLDMLRTSLAARDADDSDGTITAMWSLHIEQLQQRTPAALDLLMLCAVLADEPVPRSMFRHTVAGPPVDVGVAFTTQIEFAAAIREIGAYSLARIDHRDGTIQLHRVTRKLVRQGMSAEDVARFEDAARALVGQAVRADNDAAAALLLPHAQALGLVDSVDPVVRRLIVHLVDRLVVEGEGRTAVQLSGHVAATWAALLGASHSETLAMTTRLGLAHQALSEHIEAVEVHRTVHQRYRDSLGAEHESTLIAGRSLLRSLRTTGDHAEAATLGRDVHAVATRVLGADDPFTIAVADDLGTILCRLGDPSAQAMQERNVERKRYLLGDDHPSTLATITNLAVTMRIVDAPDMARRLNENALRHLRGTLDEDHLLTLTCAMNLASDLYALGEYQRARDLDASLAERATRTLGDDHPSTMAVLVNLALDLDALSRHTEASGIHAELVQRFRRVLGADHPLTAAAQAKVRSWCEADFDMLANL